MKIAHLAGTLLVLVAVEVAYAIPQYRLEPQQRHWYMFNRNNPAVDPRVDSIYDNPALRGGLAEKLSPLQRSALTDFLARYFPRLFRPAIAPADPAAGSLPPGATVYTGHASSLLPYDSFPVPNDDYNVPEHTAYSGYSYQRPADGHRGSYLPYPGRGHAYPPGLSYPLDPYQTGYKKLNV